MKVTGIVINNSFEIIGLTLTGTANELGYGSRDKFERSFNINDVKQFIREGRVSNMRILRENQLSYTGSGNWSSLGCRDINDMPIDNTIEITQRIVQDNKVIGFEIMSGYLGAVRLKTSKLIEIASYMKCKNFVVKNVNGKNIISSKGRMKSIKELPIIDLKNKCGDNVYWKLSGGILKITGEGNMWDDMSQAFKNIEKSKVHSLIISDNVTSIGDNAFKEFKKLGQICISAPIKAIGNDAFRGCVNISEIVLPNSLTDIKHYAFEDCKKLKEITIPDSVIRIGRHIFAGCENLETIRVGSGLQYWGYMTLGCLKLKKIIISNKNKSFKCIDDIIYSMDGKWVLACVPIKKGKVNLISGVVNVADYAFFDCDGITMVDMGKDIETIGKASFKYCSSLREVKVGPKIKSIEGEAFEDCKKFSFINLPDANIQINPTAFSGCDKFRFGDYEPVHK